MMGRYYTDEENVQILIALLKSHGIRRVIASPGTTNSSFVGSLQGDAYFEMFSSVDERSAAYLACGMAAESGEPVVITCTGATASRNYLPGLTEAFYRKLPVLAITGMHGFARAGHHVSQVIDRSVVPRDVVRLSVAVADIHTKEDRWSCNVKINQAILELSRHGGGPVHINLSSGFLGTFTTKTLPKTRKIDRIVSTSQFPALPSGRVAVFVGSHKTWTDDEIVALERFCEANNAVVFCDQTSGYVGKHRLFYSLAACQKMTNRGVDRPDLLVHIGEISGDSATMLVSGREVWRVSEDGEVRDTFRKLRNVFEMPERVFFEHYSKVKRHPNESYLRRCRSRLETVYAKVPELPFSNIWLASQMSGRIPNGSVVHFGILNSLRSWNLYPLPQTVSGASNVGGFGIDGGLSSLIGASLMNANRLYYGIIGDLAFFYDMNVLGNRHVGKNLRIMVVNNGKGTEFRNYGHHVWHFGKDADAYIAAAGHFGNKSKILIKDYAEALGFDYLSATNKAEFHGSVERFLSPLQTQKSVVFEVFTDSDDESKALETMMHLVESRRDRAKLFAERIVGKNLVNLLRHLVRRK